MGKLMSWMSTGFNSQASTRMWIRCSVSGKGVKVKEVDSGGIHRSSIRPAFELRHPKGR
jgi:hypothetical protein